MRSRLASYLEGKNSLGEFQEWFIPAAWNIESDNDAELIAGEIELRLAEYTSGHLSDSELRAELLALVEGRLRALQHEIVFSEANPSGRYSVTLRFETEAHDPLEVRIG